MALSESEIAAVFMKSEAKVPTMCPVKAFASREDFSQEVFLKFLSWSRRKNLRWESPADVRKALLRCATYVKKEWKRTSFIYSSRIRLSKQTPLESIPSREDGHSSLEEAPRKSTIA